MYDKMIHCNRCGRELDPSYSSYSIKPRTKEVVCIECDLDGFLPQKEKEE